MLVKCPACGEIQPWQPKGGPRLAQSFCRLCKVQGLRKMTGAEERARRAAFAASLPPRAPVAVAASEQRPPAVEQIALSNPVSPGILEAAREFRAATREALAHKAAAAVVRALAPVLFAQRLTGQYHDRAEQARHAIDDARALADALAEGGYLE